jgi:Histidine-specific methyltransferase, SAM-dependent
LILDYYLEKNVPVHYFPLDVSYDMLELALHEDEGEILSAVMEKGSVTGIHSTFSDLRAYKQLFENRDGPNIFLLLGNTLGNELSETRTLIDIKDGMQSGDILLTELQLLEDNPKSPEELTISIQPTKYFYAAPFTLFGLDIDQIKVRLDKDESDLSSQKYGTMTYSISCNFPQGDIKIEHPAFEGPSPVRISKSTVPVYIVRKYKEEMIRDIFEEAGFEVLKQRSTAGEPPNFHRFHYVTARKH